ALAGESGIDWIRAFDASEFPVRVAAEVKDFDASGAASPKEQRKLDRNVLLALAAGKEAVEHAGLNGFDPHRVGIAFGSAIGGTEAAIHPIILAGFVAMRGLAVEDEHPPRASRPFDATRAGFVMGEGACVLVLEELEAARARGATLYAEVLAYGTSNDAHHMAQPEPEAIGVGEMMRAAIDRAGLEPKDVGYINAH